MLLKTLNGEFKLKSRCSLKCPCFDTSDIILDFKPGGTVVKNLPVKAGYARDTVLISGSGRSPGVENGNPLQYFCLENPMDRGAWQSTVQSHKESDRPEAT